MLTFLFPLICPGREVLCPHMLFLYGLYSRTLAYSYDILNSLGPECLTSHAASDVNLDLGTLLQRVEKISDPKVHPASLVSLPSLLDIYHTCLKDCR